VGANIHMTARQAETILMLSDWKNAQVVILSIVEIEESEANAHAWKQVRTLQRLSGTMAAMV
jgi:hypothetical protein